jgi:hypothetical protein
MLFYQATELHRVKFGLIITGFFFPLTPSGITSLTRSDPPPGKWFQQLINFQLVLLMIDELSQLYHYVGKFVISLPTPY